MFIIIKMWVKDESKMISKYINISEVSDKYIEQLMRNFLNKTLGGIRNLQIHMWKY